MLLRSSLHLSCCFGRDTLLGVLPIQVWTRARARIHYSMLHSSFTSYIRWQWMSCQRILNQNDQWVSLCRRSGGNSGFPNSPAAKPMNNRDCLFPLASRSSKQNLSSVRDTSRLWSSSSVSFRLVLWAPTHTPTSLPHSLLSRTWRLGKKYTPCPHTIRSRFRKAVPAVTERKK